jgi:hypothetical protein
MLEYNRWKHPEGWSPEECSSSALFIATISTMVESRSQGFPPGSILDHFVLARQLRQRQLPGNPWEVHSDKTPVRELLDDARACASRGVRWLMDAAHACESRLL